MLDNTPNQLSKFRTKTWVEINDDARERYNINSPIKFKTSIIRSRLCDYSDAYMLVKGNIRVTNTAADGAAPKSKNKKVIFKNWAPFTDFISEINNKEIDHTKDIDIAMPIYNLIKYSDNYSKTSGSLWQYYRDKPFIRDNGNMMEQKMFK